jgi:hypothetical protein
VATVGEAGAGIAAPRGAIVDEVGARGSKPKKTCAEIEARKEE